MVYSAHDIVRACLHHAERGNNPDATIAKLQLLINKYPSLRWSIGAMQRRIEQYKTESDRDTTATIAVADSNHVTPELLGMIAQRVMGAPDAPYTVQVNPDVIGGFIVKHNGVVHDYSLRQQLNKLAKIVYS